MTGNRSKLLKGAAWIGAANIIANLLGVVSTVALARLLEPEDFGLIAIASAVIAIISVISQFSLYQALVQREKPEPEHFHTAWTMNVMRGVIVAATIALLAYPLASLYDDPRLQNIFFVMAITNLVGSFVNPKLAVFERRLQFSQTFILLLTSKFVGFAATIPVAFVYRSYWAIVVGPLASEVAIVIVSYFLLPYRPKATLARYKDLLSYSIWLTFGNWVQALNWRSDPLVLGYFLTPTLLGQYEMGNRLVSKTIGEVRSPIAKVLFPAFARIRGDPVRLRSGYLRSQGVLCMLCFPVAAGFAVVAPELVLGILGEKWKLAIPIVQVTAVIRILQMTENLNAVAMASGDTKLLFGRDIRVFFLRWPFIVAGVYFGWGDTYNMLIGALFGRAASVILNMWLNMDLIRKITTITIKDHFKSVWRPAFAAMVMAMGVTAMRPLLQFGSDTESLVLRLLIMTLLGAIIYFATAVFMWVATGKRAGIETEVASITKGLIGRFLGKVKRRKAVR